LLRELAENANTYQPLGYGQQRLEDPRFVIFLGRSRQPWSTVVQRVRLRAEEVEDVVAEVRDLLRRLGRPVSTWEIGGSATPADLVERLEALGMVPDREPLAIGMALTEPPPPAPPEIEVARVETVEDYLAAVRVFHEAFDVPEEARAVERADVLHELAVPTSALYLARLDGEPVAAARATFAEHGVVLNAGSTLPHARGRGAYRALVAERWEEAVRRGTPALITQAGAQSRPILQRLGFREVAEIRILLDEPPVMSRLEQQDEDDDDEDQRQ
jgi:GNAT superfamily N-acetyltransferase